MKMNKLNVMNTSKTNIYESFNVLATEAQDLYLRSDVAVLSRPISSLEFYRDWVSTNIPVLFRGAVKHWPAVTTWGLEYLRATYGDKLINVDVTPNGYADAIAKKTDGLTAKEYFVMPEERTMKMSEFLNVMENPEKYSGVFYIQRQNSNLTKDFPELLCDIGEDISWATGALGCEPEASNIWIGDERAVTSMHKDPYENLYCVISGHKDFILLPPTDRPWIPYKHYPSARYEEVEPGHFEIIPFSTKSNSTLYEENHESGSLPSLHVETQCSDASADCGKSDSLEKLSDNFDNCVPWICIDPLKPDYSSYPLYRNASPVRVEVRAGDMLYLPSLWFHHVQQSHACIAVNYWFDMKYDLKYAYFKFLESLTNKCLD